MAKKIKDPIADAVLNTQASAPTADRPLGPLQDIWEAWIPCTEFVDGMPDIYFRNILTIQMNEIDDHVEAGDPLEKVINEMVDLMSVSMNWMRSKGLTDVDVAEAIHRRTSRFIDVQAIMDQYNENYGL